MSIFEKVIKILQTTPLCKYCLGRMFSLLATATTNEDRGESLLLSLTIENHQLYFSGDNSSRETAIHNLRLLAEKANFLPAQEVLKKEGFTFSEELSKKKCFLCNGIFENVDDYAVKAIEKLKDLEFNSFLVGTTPDATIINKEDKFKSENTLLQAESLKSHLNREIGKKISEKLQKDVDFEIPDITIIFSFDYETFKINLIIRSLFIYGRYKKLIRGIPQTRWPCGKCGGKGCEECNFTGKQYTSSVEELVTPLFLEAAKSSKSKFHGAGREDIDVKMVGTGRPFILELLDPKKRYLDLNNLKEKVNEINEGKIEISDLRFSEKEEVIRIKENAEFSKKTYKALVESENDVSRTDFESFFANLKNSIEEEKIKQRTPHRVSHRRADKVRKKKIFEIKGSYINSKLFEFTIKTQGGTYIKELISGDEGRTEPSFSSIFKQNLTCKQLDVIEIEYK